MAKKGKDMPKNVARLANEKHPSALSPVKLFDVKQARAAVAYALNLTPGDQEVDDHELAEFLTNLGGNLLASAGVRTLTSNVVSMVTIRDKRRIVSSGKIHHVRNQPTHFSKPSVPSHMIAQNTTTPDREVKMPYNPLKAELLAAKQENARNMRHNSRICSRIRALSRLHAGPHPSVQPQKEKEFILESIAARKQLDQHMSEVKARVKIVVIGAGLAGLSAANQLISFGFRKVIVLEALDRVGGRIYSVPYYSQSNTFLEMGPDRVDHAKDDNSVYSLVTQFGLGKQIPVESRNDDIITLANGAKMQTDVASFLSMPPNVIHNDIHLINSHIKSNLHQNVKLSFDDYLMERHRRIIHSNTILTSSQHARVFKIVNKLSLPSKYQLGHTQDTLAVHLLGSNQDSRSHVTLPSGMASMLDPLMSNFKTNTLMLQTCVNRIERQTSSSLNHLKVKITCSDGRFFQANHVIVAVPLGFLKENADKMFAPALPAEKMAAMNKVCVGTVGKIFLCYARPFWSYPVHFTWLGTKSTRYKLLAQTLTFRSLDMPSNVLEVRFLGNTIETMPDYDITRQLSSILSIYYGIHPPAPVHTRKTKWCSSLLFRGTHPFLSMECSKKEQQLLEQPLMNGDIPEVLFAGDYTYEDYSCLLHAARASGLREANRINNFYNASYCFENINP